MSVTPRAFPAAYPGLTVPGTVPPGSPGGATIDLNYSYSLKVISSVDGDTWFIPDTGSIEMGFEYCDTGALQFSYAIGGINADRIAEDSIVIGYCDGVELPDGRWHIQAVDGDPYGEEPYTRWTGKSLLNPLEKVVVLGVPGQGLEDNLDFTGKSIGYILNFLFNAAQARGAMLGYTWSFTSLVDSNGIPWTGVLNRSFPIGSSYADVLRALNGQGLIEFRFKGDVVRVFSGMTMGTDASDLVELIAGRDYQDTPYRRSIEDRATFTLVGGDEGTSATSEAPSTSFGPFGREEAVLTQSGTTDTALLGLVAATYIDANARTRSEFTREVTVRADGPRHGKDYKVGDTIGDRVGSGVNLYKVRSIVVRVDEDAAASASIVLNDKFYDREVANAIKLDNIFSGVTTGGIPTTTTNLGTPLPPTSVLISSEAYLNNDGRPRAVATVDWVEPTGFTNGKAITDPVTYDLQWRYTGATTWRTSTVATDYAVLTNLDPGKTIQVQIRAVVSGKFSTFSPVVTSGPLLGDTTAPGKPSAVTTQSARGIINVSFDWTLLGGGPLPIDTAAAELHMSQTSDFTPSSTSLYAAFLQAGQITVTGLVQNGLPWFFKVVAVDNSGNRSVPSDQVGQTVNRISGPDLQVNSITGNELAFGSISTDHMRLGVLRSNLVADSSFEDGYTLGPYDPAGVYGPATVGNTYQWRRSGNPYDPDVGVTTQTRGRARSGNKALSLRVSIAGSSASAVSNSFLLKPGSTYRFSFSAASVGVQGNLDALVLKGPSADTVSTTAGFTLDGSGDWLASPPPLASAPTSVASAEYARYEAEFTVDPAETSLWAQVRFVNQTPAVGGTTVIDDVSVIEEGFGGATDITAAGIQLYDNNGKESAAMVSNRPNVFSVIKDDDVIAALADSGSVLGKTGSFEGDVSMMGVPMLGRYGDYPFDFWNGYDTTRDLIDDPVGLLEGYAKGQVAEAWYTGGDFPTAIADDGRTITWQMNVETVPGRQYGLNTTPILLYFNGPGRASLTVYRTLNGTDPIETPSQAFVRCHVSAYSAGYETIQVGWRQFAGSAAARDTRFLFSINNWGPATIQLYDDPIGSSVLDVGYMTNRTGTLINQYIAATATPAPTRPATKKTYTTTWTANASQTRRGTSPYGNNTINPTTYTGSQYTLAGYYSGTNGNQFSLIGFTGAATSGSHAGSTIGTAISGATIKKIEVYVKNADFYANSGGSQRFGMSNLGSVPTSTTRTPPTAAYSSNRPFSTGQAQWVALPTTAHALLTGGGRVVVIGPGSSSSQTYYSKWNNHAATSGKPALRITYEK